MPKIFIDIAAQQQKSLHIIFQIMHPVYAYQKLQMTAYYSSDFETLK